MFHRYLSLFLIALLTVSGRAAWAFDVFVDINAKNASTTADLQAYPTGVSPGGACVLQGAQASNASYYDVCYYPGTAHGTMTNMNSAFTYSSATFARAMGDAMNDKGDFSTDVFVATPQVQWLTTNGGTNTTYNANVPSGSGNQIRGIGIDENDDICGVYTGRPTTLGVWPYVSINNGGGSFTTYTLSSGTDAWPSAMTTPTTAGGVTSGLVAGFTKLVATQNADVWSYSISGGTMTSTETDLQSATNNQLAAVCPDVTCSSAIAVNSSGQVAIAACNGGGAATGAAEYDNATFIYNMNTHGFTPLTQGSTKLLFYDPFPGTISEGGHEQAINNAGQVVGYTGVQSTGTWQAAMWQPNGSGGGSIVNLNTEYASILPAGVTLNNATAIDNNGDIAGVCTDAANNTMQAFVIYAPLPGDANLDNRVDVNDLTIVLSNFGRTGMTWSEGEFTGDGTVDVNDLTIVVSHFGQTIGASAVAGLSAVPEPGSLLLLVLAAAGLLAAARRRAQR